ncbi:NAD-dependent epimerase/dehydratase family protein [Flavobacterium humidisoli]|uniref:NAD-dependent epimerase/dehydratase family protein n=1 Tax=Flavobacterium humidisoli TaxID=2937442 RepID=A0ABY4LSK6_9FLAO|nr:NAD-dependent epimerase/dehydratase family protein [Flavobacterium humidisoli]UPZ16074.1 NAD-dependent epimerase/dehydratase family protein [Flavobacterium humidisoli]
MLNFFEDDLNLIYDNTKGILFDENDKTFFLTGGTGFFGIWIIMSFLFVNRKLKLNSKMIVLTRDKKKFLLKHGWIEDYREISFLEGDISSFEFIENNIDYIIHAATEASIKLNDEKPLVMFETIVLGTQRILEFARIKKVKSFLLTSSGAVYGKQPSDIEKISEDYIGAPVTSDAKSMYGEGKRMAELLCATYHKLFNLPVKVARCYAFIGPFLELNSHFAAGNFIKNLLNNEDIIIEGDGTPYRSYMYSADLTIWLWTILIKGKNNSPYNVGSSNAISIEELADLISKKDDSSQTKVIIKTKKSNIPALRYVPDVDKAMNELNLRIYTDLEACLEKTISFNKNILNISK